jgi:prepilin-type N-terminal cleavage/methylation domain-containing protein/prepilin-type processing-associated H-X9-DG protein
MCSRSRSRQAFTLIEVLVVVAIIALLISILIPSLNKARELARRTVCRTHLDQMYKGHIYYAQDYKGFFPHPDWWLWDNSPTTGNTWYSQVLFWPSLYARYGGSRPTDSSRWVEFGHIYKYIKNKETYFCPKDTLRRKGAAIGAGGVYGNKPINSYVRLFHPHDFMSALYGSSDTIPNAPLPDMLRSWFINPDQLPRNMSYDGQKLDTRPTRLGLMYEEFQNYDDIPTWMAPNKDSMLNDGYSWFCFGGADYISMWHLGSSQVLFWDGHAVTVDATKFNRDREGYGKWVAAGGPRP